VRLVVDLRVCDRGVGGFGRSQCLACVHRQQKGNNTNNIDVKKFSRRHKNRGESHQVESERAASAMQRV